MEVGQTENALLIQRLRHRRRMGMWAIVLVLGGCQASIALHSAAATGLMMALTLAAMLYVVRLSRKLRAAQTPQAESGNNSIIPVVIGHGILATILALPHDPIMGGILTVVAVITLLMAIAGKRRAAHSRFAMAVIYGLAALSVKAYIAGDIKKRDELVVKLEEYKQQHGSYPENMEALIPALLPEIPRAGIGGFRYQNNPVGSYWLNYQPSVAGPCSYTPERKTWHCQSR